jgi:hypothetical protein
MASFFHVDFRGGLRAGDVLQCLPVTSAAYPEEAAFLNEQFPEGLSFFGAALVLHSPPDHPEAVVEQILETVRRQFAEKCGVSYPSRLSSLFGTDSLQAARAFRTCYQRENAKIWLVEAADYFKGDMNFVNPGLISDHELAVRYWQGRPKNGSPTSAFWEYLLRLPVRVVRRVDPADLPDQPL